MNHKILNILHYILGYHLSIKMQFAIKTSLSIVIVYIISFWQGWSSPITSAITIALIASLDSMNDSLIKGLYRTLGTLLGAFIGICLLIMFPQDRMLYLISASLLVTLFFYIARIYRGDTTIFFLTGMTILLVFQSGNVEQAFLYGINRTYMTIFGIGVYTIVGALLWSTDTKENIKHINSSLSKSMYNLFIQQDKKLIDTIIEHQQKLLEYSYDPLSIQMSKKEFISIKNLYNNLTKELILYINDLTNLTHEQKKIYIYQQHKQAIDDIVKMFQDSSFVAKSFKDKSPQSDFEKLPILHQARITTAIKHLSYIHTILRELALLQQKINSKIPNISDMFKNDNISIYFNFYDTEAIKSAFITFLTFWISTWFWINFNPPLGFYSVAMATSFSFLTSFSPIKPSLLIIAYTLSFITSLISFLFILPNLVNIWEFGLYLGIFTFLVFYFVELQATVFFIIGLSTLNISNDMSYSFMSFMLFWSMFYVFLFILLFLYYIPFSHQPQHLYLKQYKNYFDAILKALKHPNNLHKRKFHIFELHSKMLLWSTLIDNKYFDKLDISSLNKITQLSKHSAYLIMMYLQNIQSNKKNHLINEFNNFASEYITRLLQAIRNKQNITTIQNIEEKMEQELKIYFQTKQVKKATQDDIISFFEYINLQKDICHTLNNTLEQSIKANLHILKESKF